MSGNRKIFLKIWHSHTIRYYTTINMDKIQMHAKLDEYHKGNVE